MRFQAKTRGMTLIEVLVAISIVAFLTALIVPAVLAARNAARRSSCSNHLRQLSLALNSYSDSFGVYPPGSTMVGYSFQASLLPFIEQSSLFHSINFEDSAATAIYARQSNFTAAQVQLELFLCPSDSLPFQSLTAVTNYAGNGGYGITKYGQNGLFVDCSISNAARKRFGPAQITDGTSQTIGLTEWVLGLPDPKSRDPLSATFKLKPVLPIEAFEAFAQACREIDPYQAKLAGESKGKWIVGEYGDTMLNFSLPPNNYSCMYGDMINWGVYSASSRHGDGVQVAFLDGHASFVRNSINISEWRALSTPSGREIISDSF